MSVSFGLDPAAAPPARRADWLADRLRVSISTGVLPAGTAVPPSRVLAAELGFARGTVVEAYQRLIEETMLIAQPRRGIRVAASATPPTSVRPEPVPDAPIAARIDLAHGVPDVTAFPRAAWLRAEREVLAGATAAQLGYPPPAGTVELREALAGWLLRSRGVVASPDDLLVTGGVAGALSMLAQVLAARGETTMATEDPGNAGTRHLLERWLPHVAGIRVDRDGLDVDELARSAACTVLVTPAHQYPTGVVLAPERRRALVTWAESASGLIIEDDYDAEHRYDRRPVRALQPLAPTRIAYTSSLSKTLTPALRLGWLIAPPPLRADLVELRRTTDLGTPGIPQLVLALLLERGVIERHLRTVRVRHRKRRDALVAALRAEIPDLRIGGIAAGLHLVIETDDDVRVAARLAEDGIDVLPLSALSVLSVLSVLSGQSVQQPGRSGLVLHYGNQPEHVLTAVAPRIARAMRG